MSMPLRDCSGFTLIEVLIGTSLTVFAASALLGGAYQAFSAERFRRDEMSAVVNTRHAGAWFASDALNAETTDLVDGGPPAACVTLTWNDRDDVGHALTYRLTDGLLIRDLDGAQVTVARGVVSVEFFLSDRLLTMDLEVAGELGGLRASTHQTYLRSLR